MSDADMCLLCGQEPPGDDGEICDLCVSGPAFKCVECGTKINVEDDYCFDCWSDLE
jgi:predicted amidophosphoribosyltransferase